MVVHGRSMRARNASCAESASNKRELRTVAIESFEQADDQAPYRMTAVIGRASRPQLAVPRLRRRAGGAISGASPQPQLLRSGALQSRVIATPTKSYAGTTSDASASPAATRPITRLRSASKSCQSARWTRHAQSACRGSRCRPSQRPHARARERHRRAARGASGTPRNPVQRRRLRFCTSAARRRPGLPSCAARSPGNAP